MIREVQGLTSPTSLDCRRKLLTHLQPKSPRVLRIVSIKALWNFREVKRISRITRHGSEEGYKNVAKSRKRTITASTKQPSKSALSPLWIGGVVVAAIILVGGLILLGNQSRGGPAGSAQFDFSQFPTKGNNEATVTFIDFSNYG